MSAALSRYANPDAAIGHAGTTERMPSTCHAYPWALVRRGGQVDGQRARHRLAYLTGTYVPRGGTKAESMTGFFVRVDRRGQVWRATKGTVRVSWGDVEQSWRRQPSADQITRAKRAVARATRTAS